MYERTTLLLSTPANPIVKFTTQDRIRGESGGEWVTYQQFRILLHTNRLVISQVRAVVLDSGTRVNGRAQALQFIKICPRCGRLLGFCAACGGYHRCDNLMAKASLHTEDTHVPGPPPDLMLPDHGLTT